jgi:hypothetical protein
MVESVITIFERLLQEAPGAEPYYVRETDWFDDETRNTPETKALWDDFVGQYVQVVQDVVSAWGEPEFQGSWEDAAFPDWHPWVLRLTYWQRGEAIAYVECDHQDPECPMALVIGVKAGEELEVNYTED